MIHYICPVHSSPAGHNHFISLHACLQALILSLPKLCLLNIFYQDVPHLIFTTVYYPVLLLLSSIMFLICCLQLYANRYEVGRMESLVHCLQAWNRMANHVQTLLSYLSVVVPIEGVNLYLDDRFMNNATRPNNLELEYNQL